MNDSPQNRFPVSLSAVSSAFEDQPVLLNGMKVIFAERVPVYPVVLERKEPGNGSVEPGKYPDTLAG